VPDDDGGKPPKPGVSSRKQGRPPKDLAGRSGAQREFADIIRKEFFDRLADLGVTTAQISAALGEGFSGPSLSKYRAGERVPDRDKVLRLLAYAEERVGRPLGDGVREHVLAKYSAALRETNPQLHRFYELMDERERAVSERDEAREEHKRARDELVQCQQSLAQALLRAEQLEAEAQRAEQEEARRQEREEAAENEIVRLQEEQDELLRAVRGARAGQQAARKEIRRLEDLLLQQGQETARSEAGLKDENAALAADVSAAADRVAELEQTEQTLRGELEQVTAALEQAEARNSELASQHAVVLRSRAEVSRRLSVVRRQRGDLEDKLAEAKQRVSARMRQLTVAERRVARVESELVAVYRSRDALLDDPTAPGQVVTEAVEAVDAAWQSYEGEIARIEQHAVVPPGETTPPAAGTGEPAGATADEVNGYPADAQGSEEPPGGPHDAARSHYPYSPPPSGTAAAPHAATSRPAPSRDRPSRDQIFRDLKRSNRELDRAMRRLRRGRKAKRLDPFDVTAWALFGGFVLLIFLVSAVWPQDWWPRDTGDSKDTTMADDTGEYEEDEPIPDEGPTPKWSLALPHPLSNRPVLDGTVLVTTAWQGAVYGVDTRTGRKLWSLTSGFNLQPVVSGGLTHLREFGGLRTIDTRTGRVKWEWDDFYRGLAAGDGTLVTTSDYDVLAFRQSDGKALWSAKVDDIDLGHPALNKDTVYVFVESGKLYAFDARTGAVRWSKDVTGEEGSRGPVLAGTTVIVGAGKQIVALDSRNGKELWRKNHTLVADSDMVTASGLLIFNASVKGGQKVTAVDLKDGTEKWGQLRSTGRAQLVSLSASADRLYATYDNEKLCAHSITDGALKGCFQGINTLPSTTATADGVYAISYNQRLYYFKKEAFE